MKPGRDLDALVAEKVMGWTVSRRNGDFHLWAGSRIPAFSSKIAAAWIVLEKMEKPVRLHIRNSATLVDFPGGIVSEASSPHAICIAALRAVGVEV